MLLNLEQMRAIVRGAVRIEERDGVFFLNRFTESQANAYLNAGEMDFYKKSFAASCIRLAFRTDSPYLSFAYHAYRGSSRGYAWFDLYVDGQMVKHFGTDGGVIDEGRVKLDLPVGIKDVELYLPWSRRIDLFDVELADGSQLEGLTRKYRMIAFGDSITQGYDASYPSLSYVARLARLLDADEVNKGIGGDVFCPYMIETPDDFTPELITVAYGTNNWTGRTYEFTRENCVAFYTRLSEQYPTAKIFAITPICRLDTDKTTPYGDHVKAVDTLIREVCADLSNVTVINGWSFVPALKEFFDDQRVHPNDLGFGLYAEGLYREIVKELYF